MVRDFMAIGDDEIPREELIAEGCSEGNEQKAGFTQKFRTLFHILINIGLKILKILFRKTSVVRKTHPKIPIFVKIPVFIEKIGLEHETQRPVNGNRVKEHTERVGTDIKAMNVEIVAHIV
jgi:hypothetical protein